MGKLGGAHFPVFFAALPRGGKGNGLRYNKALF